ncbi:MAG: hypothetical protein ACREQW_11555 [Candidatus Binatia bacterium]
MKPRILLVNPPIYGYVNSLGIRIMLSELAPIPGTPDGEMCRGKIDLDEPLLHNKTAFTMRFLGHRETQRIKGLAATLNQRLTHRLPVGPPTARPLAGNP